MSRVSISRSYAILVGLEAYVKTRKKVKKGIEKVEEKKEEIIHPEEVARQREKERDKTKSAEKERRVLEENRKKNEEEKRKRSWSVKLMNRLGIRGEGKKEEEVTKVDKREGEDIESGIAPDGKR